LHNLPSDPKQKKNDVYNSPRAKEGVRLFSGLNAITGAFTTAKDVIGVLFQGNPSDSANDRPATEDDSTSHPYNTRSTNPEKRMKVESVDRDTKMEDSEYVSVSRHDFIEEQQRAYQGRMSLLIRLANMCKCIAVYNRTVEGTQNWRRHWTQRQSMFEMNLMWPYYPMTKREWQETRQNLNHEKSALNKEEQALKRHAEAIRTNVLDWNTDAMRLNMSLIENPVLDASSYMETLIMFKISGQNIMALVTQHNRFKLVQPGEYLENYFDRVEEAQSTAVGK